MEEKNNNKGLIILVCILGVLVLALGEFVIYDKVISKPESKPEENSNIVNNCVNKNENISDNNVIKYLINSTKINNLTFDKPTAGGIGGEPYTLATNMTVDLECTNDSVAGIQVSGYCLDKNNNKYLFEGPTAVMAFYCNNNPSHEDKGVVQAYQLFKTDGSNYIIPEKTKDINWEEIEITYCKFDNANLMLTDGSEISTKISISYEKSFK